MFGICGYYRLYVFINKCLGDSLWGTLLEENLLEWGTDKG